VVRTSKTSKTTEVLVVITAGGGADCMFADRLDAGRQLGRALTGLLGEPVVVLGLPRGGVPVAAEVATALAAPLDVILVRKLGLPFHRELAMGAIGEDGVRVLNRDVLDSVRVTDRELAAVETDQRVELERRAALYRRGRLRLDLTARTALVVDDGVATGSTAVAACRVARAHGARRVILAVPVAPRDAGPLLARDADEFVTLCTPDPFIAVGRFYDDFRQVSDDEVVEVLERAGPRGVGEE
jgi:putative phosphoribosyl transferase